VTISGNVATIVGAGRAGIMATNAGTEIFAPANRERTFTVDKAEQKITFRLREKIGLRAQQDIQAASQRELGAGCEVRERQHQPRHDHGQQGDDPPQG
jgi:hypothetical protein